MAKQAAVSQSRSLLELPTEIRLEIYRQCSAFTLLVLSASARSFRTEIHDHPSIYKHAYGYNPGKTDTFWPNLTPEPTFAIRNIKCLLHASEMFLLHNTLLAWSPEEGDHASSKTGAYGCCVVCMCIQRSLAFRLREDKPRGILLGGTEFWSWCNYCEGCVVRQDTKAVGNKDLLSSRIRTQRHVQLHNLPCLYI
ncbi:hypothetical protein BJ508DRAFT_416378 [Ascobolus immersus RN42]|uniref:F-box domain-containing protein n=1 Tax=Ascobolus immersus RN42 TaxID=1160509 RepID=A0A3N4I023_ASCIM|nr:hypothetical protein BJ508DRAFT_416378 [Ascobolus immersus RN42]